jgi:hypothetical protein
MAQTLIAKPNTFYPAFNKMPYIVDSTNKNKQAFNYIFDVYEAGTANIIARYQPKPRFGDGYGYADISKLLQSKLAGEIENANATSFFNATNSFYKFDVKVGESYIDSVPYTSSLTNSGGYVQVNVTNSYVAGDQIYITQDDGGAANPQVEGYQTITSVGVGFFVIGTLWSTVTDATINGSITYADNRRTVTTNILTYTNQIVFNGVFNTAQEIAYDGAWFTLTGNTKQLLTPMSEITISKNSPLLLNIRTQSSGSGELRYENDGGDVFSLPMVATDEITMANVGTYNLPSLTLVSGTAPLVKPTTQYYDVYWYDGGQKSKSYRINISQQCAIEEKSILFIDKYGSILSIPVTLKSTLRTNVTREMYTRDLTGVVTGTKWIPKANEGAMVQVNSNLERSVELNTQYLNKEMQELFFQMIESPQKVLFDDGSFYPVVLDVTNAEFKRTQNAKLFMYTLSAKYSNNEAVNG